MSKILLGVSGGIAIYKVAQLASDLSKKHELKVIMTENAGQFMSTQIFQALSQNKVYTDTFSEYAQADKMLITHVELAKWADIIVLAPATANLIAKFAHGIADDLLTTTLLAARSPILLCPAMNSYMLNNPATRTNLEILSRRNIEIMPTEAGELACGDYGNGKLADVKAIETRIDDILAQELREQNQSNFVSASARKNSAAELSSSQDLTGLNVLLTAGPTRENIDPVRFISNYSSGKMGYALAENAKARGAKVTLISGPTSINVPEVDKFIEVESAREMFLAVQANLASSDIFVMNAAVSDYRVSETASQKIKKQAESMQITLVKNPDILTWAGKNAQAGTVLCGFAMETENLIGNAKEKLQNKKIDLIVANSLSQAGAGFGSDTNVITIIGKHKQEDYPKMSKHEAAARVLDACLEVYKRKNQID